MSGVAQPADRQLARTLPRQQVAATQFGVVVFLASDIMLFAPFFAAYFLLRENNPPWPPEGVHLDVARAALATAALVASSFTLVRFEHLGAHRPVNPGGGCSSRSSSAPCSSATSSPSTARWISAPPTTRTARSSGC